MSVSALGQNPPRLLGDVLERPLGEVEQVRGLLSPRPVLLAHAQPDERRARRCPDEGCGHGANPVARIAHNLAANFYRDRSRKPESAIEDAGMISSPHTTESLVEGREELKSILAGVQQLPDDRREALIMRFALGMDNREIARALGRTDGATKVLLHRAIRQLEGLVAESAAQGAGEASG